MSTISNLNIVVQHGDSAKDVHNIKNTNVESGQLTAVQQEKEEEQNKTVQKSENSEQAKTDSESSSSRREKEKEKKKKKAEKESKASDATGGLLDTVA